MASMLSRLGRQVRRVLLRLLLVVVCLAIIVGVATGFYAYYAKSPRAKKAREAIEQSKAKAKEEGLRLQERFEDLTAKMSESVESVAEGDEDTPGLRQRIEEIKQQIAEFDKDNTPELKERAREWFEKAEATIEALREQSKNSQVGDELKGLIEQFSSAMDEAKKEASPGEDDGEIGSEADGDR
jgi:chromosome segregation ATPase